MNAHTETDIVVGGFCLPETTPSDIVEAIVGVGWPLLSKWEQEYFDDEYDPVYGKREGVKEKTRAVAGILVEGYGFTLVTTPDDLLPRGSTVMVQGLGSSLLFTIGDGNKYCLEYKGNITAFIRM